jgi:ABC-type sulfate transport system permease component
MEDVIVALPPLYRDFSTSDKHYVKNYGLTCAGILIALIVIFFIASTPAILDQIQNPGTFVTVETNPEFAAMIPYTIVGGFVTILAVLVGVVYYLGRRVTSEAA